MSIKNIVESLNGLFKKTESELNESSEEDVLARRGFLSLVATYPYGYSILNDGNFVKRVVADNDEDAIAQFDQFSMYKQNESLSEQCEVISRNGDCQLCRNSSSADKYTIYCKEKSVKEFKSPTDEEARSEFYKFVKSKDSKNESIWEDYKQYDGWDEDDIKLHKSIDWSQRNSQEYDAGDAFKGKATHYTVNGPVTKEVEFHKFIRPNPIFPPYYRPVDEFGQFDDSVGFMYDGHNRGKYGIHDRSETQSVYDMLSDSYKKDSKNKMNEQDSKFNPSKDGLYDYGCDSCGDRVPMNNAHWFYGQTIGLCDKCFEKLPNEVANKQDDGELSVMNKYLGTDFEDIKEAFKKQSVNENKQLNEGPGAGYTIHQEVHVPSVSAEQIKLDQMTKDVKESGTYFEATGSFTCEIKQTAESIYAQSYGYDGKVKEQQCQIYGGTYDVYSSEDIDSIDEYVRQQIQEELSNTVISTETIYGGGWSHSTYDGTLADTMNAYDVKTYLSCIDTLDISLTDKSKIDFIDSQVSGENIFETYYVRDQDGSFDEGFDSEKEAIQYAKDHEYNQVVLVTEYEDEFGNIDFYYDDYTIVWERDEDDVDESLKEDWRYSKQSNTLTYTEDDIQDVVEWLFNWHPECFDGFEQADLKSALYGLDSETIPGSTCDIICTMEYDDDEDESLQRNTANHSSQNVNEGIAFGYDDARDAIFYLIDQKYVDVDDLQRDMVYWLSERDAEEFQKTHQLPIFDKNNESLYRKNCRHIAESIDRNGARDAMFELIDEGVVDCKELQEELLRWLSSDDVYDFMRMYGYDEQFEHDEDDGDMYESLDVAQIDYILTQLENEFERTPHVIMDGQLGSDLRYFEKVRTVRQAEKFNYHSDYWGYAEDYQQQNVTAVEQLRDFIGKQVQIGGKTGKLEGLLIDIQYNSLSHSYILLSSNDKKSAKPMREQRELTDSNYKGIIGKYFDYSFDFEFQDVVQGILDRVDDFSNGDDIMSAIDDGIIYYAQQWQIAHHYCSGPADCNWDEILEQFTDDIFSICSQIASDSEEE